MNGAADTAFGKKMQPKLAEAHILWITGGLGRDGDTVSITAASRKELQMGLFFHG
jgi:hydrogenase small subunit